MFFIPKLHIKDGKQLSISAATAIYGVPEKFNDYIGKRIAQCIDRTDGTAIESIAFTLGIPASIKKKIGAQCTCTACDEAYAISLGKKTTIYAMKEQGFLFAASTLTQLCRDGRLEGGLLYDYPLFGTRGYRAFLPSRTGIADFREIVDLLGFNVKSTSRSSTPRKQLSEPSASLPWMAVRSDPQTKGYIYLLLSMHAATGLRACFFSHLLSTTTPPFFSIASWTWIIYITLAV